MFEKLLYKLFSSSLLIFICCSPVYSQELLYLRHGHIEHKGLDVSNPKNLKLVLSKYTSADLDVKVKKYQKIYRMKEFFFNSGQILIYSSANYTSGVRTSRKGVLVAGLLMSVGDILMIKPYRRAARKVVEEYNFNFKEREFR